MNEKEKKIREQRTIEAIRKNMMGATGKLGLIAQRLGEPIVLHNEGIMSEFMGITRTELPAYPEENEEEYPTMEVTDAFGYPIQEPIGNEWADEKPSRKAVSFHTLGWHFDGLGNSVHLEIKYLEDSAELTAHYKGYLIYREISGELLAYIPFPEWETHVETFYKAAKANDARIRKNEKQKRIEEGVKNKESFIQRIRKNWGI